MCYIKNDNDYIFHPEIKDREKVNRLAALNLIKIMISAGVPKELIYATYKTGRMVTTQNKKFLNKAELKEWNQAVQEYLDGKDKIPGEDV